MKKSCHCCNHYLCCPHFKKAQEEDKKGEHTKQQQAQLPKDIKRGQENVIDISNSASQLKMNNWGQKFVWLPKW